MKIPSLVMGQANRILFLAFFLASSLQFLVGLESKAIVLEDKLAQPHKALWFKRHRR